MLRKAPLVAFLLINFYSFLGLAINFHEMTVYGYETADPHEVEFENSSSVSSANIIRSSFELNYGLTDSFEIAGYVDYEKIDDQKTKLAAARIHARKAFFRRNEYFLNFGLYVEAEVPQNSDEAYTFDTKIIFQKDYDRFSLVLSPGVEYIKLKERNEEGANTELETHYSAQVKFNYSYSTKPHLDLIADLNANPTQLIVAALDYEIKHGFTVAGGIGTTNKNENVASLKVEFEIE